MNRTSLLAAVTVVVSANAFVLVHVWRNRTGPVESDVILTDRELIQDYDATADDSGVALNLRWIDPQGYTPTNPVEWMGRATLQELGFDTSMTPSDHRAREFYQRQRARRAFVALEYDGPGWHKWIDARDQSRSVFPGSGNESGTSSRLVAIDAGIDAARLRARHPDRTSVLIVPGVIRIGVTQQRPHGQVQVYGAIEELPSIIQVPLPFSEILRPLRGKRTGAGYSIHLRYGSSLEPWIVGAEIDAPTAR